MSRRNEDGYAMVAAVVAIAVFAMLATGLVSTTRGSLVTLSAETRHAKAAAAADAGLALALNGLLSEDPATRWLIDGKPRKVIFAGATLVIGVEDERGKIPVNLLDDEMAERLLEFAGLRDERLRIARDSLLDWIDDDDDPRPDGAERGYYEAKKITPRNGAILTVEELALVRGFDAAVIDRLRPFVTINWGGGPFEPRHATPEALAVMLTEGEDSPEIIQRRRELAGQQTAIAFFTDADLVGRPLTIDVHATLSGGGQARRRSVVELTGSRLRPYVIRSGD